MTFPDPLNVEGTLFFGADLTATPSDWTPTDISDRIKVSEGISLTRGRRDESGQPNPKRLTLVLDNDDGAFTPGNAASPHYPLVRRGVPIRVSLPDDGPDPKTLVEDAFSRTVDGVWGNPDTGIEWQTVHLFGSDVTPSVDGSTGLLTLAGTPNIRTAMVQGTAVVDADVRVTVGLSEVPTGTDEQVQAEFYVRGRYQSALQFRTGGSIWARLDRGDGATDLGAVVTQQDRERIVALTDTGLTFTGSETYEVRIQVEGSTHRFRIWESGTSEPGSWLWEHDDDTYAAGVVGVGCWTGGGQTNDPLVWSFDDLTVTEMSAPPLFLGQVVEWAPQWPSGDIGDYSRVRVVAGGVLRQRSQRTKRARSALFYGVTGLPDQLAANLKAYWPCEEAEGSGTVLPPGLPGLSPITISGDVEFGASAPLASTDALVRLNDGSLRGSIPAYEDTVLTDGSFSVDLVFLLQVPSGGLNDGQLIARMNSGGTVVSVEARYVSAGGGEVEVTVTDDSSSTSSNTSTDFNLEDELVEFDLTFAFNPSNPGTTFAGAVIHRISADGTREDSFSNIVASISGLWDKVGSFRIGGGLGDAVVGHVLFKTRDTFEFPYASIPLSGYNGESAVERFTRLAQATGIPAAVTGNPALSSLMGPQRPGLVLDLLRECVELDGGIMSELSTRLGLGYRARHTLYNQSPALTLDASAGTADEIQNPFEPILNDLDIVNDVTVSRQGGSSARVLDQDSIDAEGRYDEQVTVNAHTDAQLEGLASWRLHLGTWGGMRYPTLSPALDAVASLIPTWVALDLGDMVRVERLPSQHPAGSVDLLVQGTSDTLTPTGWDASANMSPEGPYHIATVGGESHEESRIDTEGSFATAGLLLTRQSSGSASTPHQPSFAIGEDMELIIEATLEHWRNVGFAQCFASKYDAATDNRSWLFSIHAGGAPRFQWSNDGISSSAHDASEVVPFIGGEKGALKISVDGDNGAGDADLVFSTAPDRNGPWVQLGTVINPGSTIDFFNATGADLLSGLTDDGQFGVNGAIHYLLWRNGSGAVLAEVDFAAQTSGSTMFTGDTGNVWSVNGSAEIVGSFVAGTDTELVVVSTMQPWVNSTNHAADFPFEVTVAGVVLEVTAIDVDGPTQVMTMTQTPVNGVVKTIPPGSAVSLANPVYVGL